MASSRMLMAVDLATAHVLWRTDGKFDGRQVCTARRHRHTQTQTQTQTHTHTHT